MYDNDDLHDEDAPERSVSIHFVLVNGDTFVIDGFTVHESIEILDSIGNPDYEGTPENTLAVDDFAWDPAAILFARVVEIA